MLDRMSQENSVRNHFLIQRRGMGEKRHPYICPIAQGFMVEEGEREEGLGRARVDRESWRWQWLPARHGPVVVAAVRVVANGSAVAAAGKRDGETLCRRKPS